MWGGGTGEKTLWGGAEGLAPCASEAAQTLTTDQQSEGPEAWSGSRDPDTFYLFLGRGQFALSGFFRHLGNGRGHITSLPATTAELLPAAAPLVCEPEKEEPGY